MEDVDAFFGQFDRMTEEGVLEIEAEQAERKRILSEGAEEDRQADLEFQAKLLALKAKGIEIRPSFTPKQAEEFRESLRRVKNIELLHVHHQYELGHLPEDPEEHRRFLIDKINQEFVAYADLLEVLDKFLNFKWGYDDHLILVRDPRGPGRLARPAGNGTSRFHATQRRDHQKARSLVSRPARGTDAGFPIYP